jgi:restriction system protein
MSWQEFEMLVGEAFRRGGYSVNETGGGGADGGIDLVLRKDGEKYLVQCKQWRANKVGVPIIRELYGAMAATGAAGGFVVTSGVFTQEAKDFAAGRNIDLIDGAELHEIIKQVQPVSSHEEKILSMTGQLCPKCGSLMVMRTAKQGMNIGKSFWGCSNYPQCRGTVPID